MTQTTLPYFDINPATCSQSSGNRALDRLRDVVIPERRAVAETSIEARASIEQDGTLAAQMERVAALAAEHPGRTSRDLAGLCRELDAYQIARRLVDLRKVGRVSQGAKAKSKNGRSGFTWWPTEGSI